MFSYTALRYQHLGPFLLYTVCFIYIGSSLMSRIECKYCLISTCTSYLAGLFEIFTLLHIILTEPMRTLCDVYHKEFNSPWCSILDISLVVSSVMCPLISEMTANFCTVQTDFKVTATKM